MIKTFPIQTDFQRSDFSISGSTLLEAINRDFPHLIRNFKIGNGGGYELVQVTLQWKNDILGGSGGAELRIRWKGNQGKQETGDNQEETTIVLISAKEEDLPLTVRPPILQPLFFPISNRPELRDPLYRLSRSHFVVFHVLPRIINACRAGRELSTEIAIQQALEYCQTNRASDLPHELDRELSVLTQAADKRIAESFVGGYSTASHNAVVRRRTERDDLPVGQRPRLYARDVLWGDVQQSAKRIVEVTWRDGTTTWEPFWSLSSQTLGETTDKEIMYQHAVIL